MSEALLFAESRWDGHGRIGDGLSLAGDAEEAMYTGPRHCLGNGLHVLLEGFRQLDVFGHVLPGQHGADDAPLLVTDCSPQFSMVTPAIENLPL